MFFEVLSAINDPTKQGSVDQLGSVTNSVQQLAKSQGLTNDQMGTVMSALGGALQPALARQSGQLGGAQLTSMLNQFSGGSGNPSAIQSMIPPQMQQQIAQTIAAKTGLNAGMIQAMMPQLINSAMGMFKMGAPKSGIAATGGNPLLNAFLDGNRNNSADLGNVMKYASRFMNAPK